MSQILNLDKTFDILNVPNNGGSMLGFVKQGNRDDVLLIGKGGRHPDRENAPNSVNKLLF